MYLIIVLTYKINCNASGIRFDMGNYVSPEISLGRVPMKEDHWKQTLIQFE